MASDPAKAGLGVGISPVGKGNSVSQPATSSNLNLARGGVVACLVRSIPLAAVVAVGLAVRAAYLGDPQLFRDEAASWYLASQSTADMLRLVSHETFPPLYVLLLKVWMTVFGDSEGALRSLSLLAGLGTLLVTWQWARDTLGDLGALIAGALVALSPAMVLDSRNARIYGLETFFATGAWWLLWLLMARGGGWSTRHRLGVAAALALAVGGEVWTMSLGIPTAGLQLLLALIGLVWLRDHASRLATGSVLLGAASLVPWLPNLLAVALNGQTFWTPRPDLGSIAVTMRGWLPGDLGGVLSPLVLVAAVGCALIGVGAALVGRLSQESAKEPRPGAPPAVVENRHLAIAIACGFGLVPVVWMYSQVHSVYDARYLGAAFPPVAIGIAAGVVVTARYSRRRLGFARRVPTGLLAIALIAPIACGTAVGAARAVESLRREAAIEPGRQMAQELASRARAGDVVIALNAETYFPLRYYLNDTGDAQWPVLSLYNWYRPTNSFFTGWEDIQDASIVDATRVAAAGWSGAVHLSPGGKLWLASLVNPGYEFSQFVPPASDELRVVETIFLQGGGVTAEIRETVPVGAPSLRPCSGPVGEGITPGSPLGGPITQLRN